MRVCDECNYGSLAGRCAICGGVGVSDAYYCKECTLQEKDVSLSGARRGLAACGALAAAGLSLLCLDLRCSKKSLTAAPPAPPLLPAQRDGCPKIINLGSARADLHFDRKNFGYNKR